MKIIDSLALARDEVWAKAKADQLLQRLKKQKVKCCFWCCEYVFNTDCFGLNIYAFNKWMRCDAYIQLKYRKAHFVVVSTSIDFLHTRGC